MFIGEYRHTIDTKKRLALPAKFRKELGKTVVITRGLDSCLIVYPLKEWRVMSDKLGKLPLSQTEARGFARVMLSGAMAVGVDGLGRVLIPEYLKGYAGLKKNVIICGLYNRLEIWDAQKWNIYEKKMEKGVEDLASKLKELGI
ncbi:MAG: cell division/cell wall cluster transcriptional repressor MraZ [Candidatus Nealsonbacteria bacterium CG_4_10_14_0_2_um_filter_39_15]|uniref:Transcriptional regulator MraZ n=1 Tax=Candidatus Nealsonbacteria bacterium CG_4_10_14_0_2_um_filter_39_15 TaxID=1974681 RepID=A0A2M7UWA2_9BACT|nr:MAG: cell division/cell wall cluster transcriptional repressor MraZ [Candidatus Nealsonbacteria bacterium CG_4_10_14_0_2_um_filter_39_15]